MTNPRFLLLTCSLFLVYTQGLWERMFGFSPAIKLISEAFIFLYLLLSIKYFRKKTPGNVLFLIYLIISFIGSIINGSDPVAWLKFVRYFVYFYLLYITLFHTSISHKQWVFILKFVVFLILIQGLGSIYNVFILNQRVEGFVGLMSSLGGTTAATFPLLIVSLSVTFYFFIQPQHKKIYLYLLACVVSAFLVGYASGKRAIFFTLPAFIVLITFLSAFLLKGNKLFYKRLIMLGFIVLVLLPVYFFGIKTTAGVNYYLSGNETNRQMIGNAIEYAINYEDSKSAKGLTTGRSGSSVQVIRNSLQNPSFILFGQGYGMVKDDNTLSRLGVNYGIVGFTRDIISGGWIVMFLTVFIMLSMIFINRSIISSFTTTLRIAIMTIFLFTHFIYSSDFAVSLKLNFLLVFLLVFINSPAHTDCLHNLLGSYFYARSDERMIDNSNI